MSWQTSAEYWKRLPRRSTIIFASAVFGIFASFAFISGNISFDRPNPTANLCFALLNGTCAAIWAIAGTRRLVKVTIVLFCVQSGANTVLSIAFGKARGLGSLDAAALKHYAALNAIAAILLIIAGYVLFLTFFRIEAGRYYAALTEMHLAGEIHRSLVPEIKMSDAAFEFYGHSWPSGEVGGDLVDVIRSNWGWLAYVADVSGHGVPAGVLMTMMKSAARTRLAAVGPEQFLPAMNEALVPLSAPNMYVTLAFLTYAAGRLQFATAGHIPILHYRRVSGRVEERSVANLPIALLGDAQFEVSRISSEPGDVLVILTDGLTEVVDSADRELGLGPLKTVLTKNAEAPLAEIAHHLRARALQHGKQVDDQTLLLVRHTGSI